MGVCKGLGRGEIGGSGAYAQLAENGARDLRRVGVFPHRALDDGQAQTPDVTLHIVGAVGRAAHGHGAAADALRCHVALAANVCFCDAGDQVARDAKVADLDLAVGVNKDVGRFDVAVDDVVVVFERFEADNGREGYLAEDILGNAACVQLVDAAAVHVLDAHVDSSFLEEGTVEVDDIGGYALVQDDELFEDGRKLGLVQLESDLFHGHDHA